MRWKDGKLRLELYGEVRESTFRHPEGPAPAVELFHTARMISESVTARSIEHAKAKGFDVSCRPGCAACCRPLIPISPLEAVWLADVVAKLPKDRQKAVRARFAGALTKLEEAGLLDPDGEPGSRQMLARDHQDGESDFGNVSRRYHELNLDCPFLENRSCSIYASRPVVCREYHVVTPKELCETLNTETRSIPWPLRMTEVLTAVGNELTEGDEPGMPLPLALEWAAAKGAVHRQPRDGVTMTDVLVETMTARLEEPEELAP